MFFVGDFRTFSSSLAVGFLLQQNI